MSVITVQDIMEKFKSILEKNDKDIKVNVFSHLNAKEQQLVLSFVKKDDFSGLAKIILYVDDDTEEIKDYEIVFDGNALNEYSEDFLFEAQHEFNRYMHCPYGSGNDEDVFNDWKELALDLITETQSSELSNLKKLLIGYQTKRGEVGTFMLVNQYKPITVDKQNDYHYFIYDENQVLEIIKEEDSISVKMKDYRNTFDRVVGVATEDKAGNIQVFSANELLNK